MSSSRQSNLNFDEGKKPQEARSAINATISRSVQPQIRVRASSLEGRRVKITDGPYKGSTGNIESCIPGNWYLISDISMKNKFDLDYIVHAKNLKILNEMNTDETETKRTIEKTNNTGAEKSIFNSTIK